MDGTPAAILIPKIHELRAKEMHNISIPVQGTELVIYDIQMTEIGTEIIPERGESVLLRELWLTALGYEILSKFNFGLRTTMKNFKQIQLEFKKAGIKYQLRRETDDTNLRLAKVSDAMASFILSKIEER